MRFLQEFWFVITHEVHTLLGLMSGRILFAAIALSILVTMIIAVRRKLSPNIRTWLWALCIPTFFFPFERSAVILGLSIPISDVTETLLMRCSYLWHFSLPTGMLVSAVIVHRERRRTLKLIEEKRLCGCAAYFHKGRSHIYLPPDFDSSYTEEQREMLLAHEKQHIAQHDPLLYRFLQTVQCVFWFCPPVHKAVRLLRQDRELLCDHHIMQGRSKYEYGMLLLLEAQKGASAATLPCLVSETGGVYERITACVKPFPNRKIPVMLMAGAAILLLAAGLIGFISPVVTEPMEIYASLSQDDLFSHTDGLERFVVLRKDGVSLDQQGLMQYAVSQGFAPETEISVFVKHSQRFTVTSCYTVCAGWNFYVGQLETEELFFPFYDSAFGKLWGFLYRII